jgi:Bacteriophage Sf6, terminase small subunit-like
MKNGRPSGFNHDIASLICERLGNGESLKAICASEDMPQARTVYRWLMENEAFSDNYARAIIERASHIFEETLEIADDGRNDWMEKLSASGEAIGWAQNGEAVNRSKLRVDTRKWFLSRMDPKKYGDKQSVEHSGSVSLGSLIEQIWTAQVPAKPADPDKSVH